MARGDMFPLTKECYQYPEKYDLEWDSQKYWHQRYSIFELFDEGIWMTNDAWFGVTPEPVANKVAQDLGKFASPSKIVVIDLFAGVGGNAIAFARSNRWSQVIAIEKDVSTIACGQRNAEIYGVADQITWVNDDCFSYLKFNSESIDISKTVIFASPPWGGPGYRTDEIFNLSTMYPYSAEVICGAAKGMDCALYLPRTSDVRQIAKLAPEGESIELVQYCMEVLTWRVLGASKAVVAYIPANGTAK